MSETLCVRWTILPQEPPEPLLHCKRCGGMRSYGPSGRIRVNANGKRVDAWLIYRCTTCDATWNRPILERRTVRSIEPALLASLFANDTTLAGRLALDAEDLRRWSPRLKEAATAAVEKEVLAGIPAEAREVQVVCVVPYPVAIRLDRLLADEPHLTRRRIRALESTGALVVSPSGPRVLRRPVRDGTRLLIALPVPDAGWIARSAARGDAGPDGE